MVFRSVKLFLFLILLFGVSAFVLSLSHRGVVQVFEVQQFLSKAGWGWILGLVLLVLSFLFIALQTLFCLSFKKKLMFLFHFCVAGILALILIFSFTAKAEYVLLYPQSYVEVDGKVVALENFSFDPKSQNLKCRVFIQDKDGKAEGIVAFNSPFISTKGFLWIQGIASQEGMPVFKFEYMEFSVVPFILFAFSIVFLILLPFVLYVGI